MIPSMLMEAFLFNYHAQGLRFHRGFLNAHTCGDLVFLGSNPGEVYFEGMRGRGLVTD